jgi:hypothetical protein
VPLCSLSDRPAAVSERARAYGRVPAAESLCRCAVLPAYTSSEDPVPLLCCLPTHPVKILCRCAVLPAYTSSEDPVPLLCCLPTHPVKILCRCAAWPAPDLQSRCTPCEDMRCAAVHTARAGECSARNYCPCVLYGIHADFHTCLWQSQCAVGLSATLRSPLTTVVVSHDRGGGGGGLACLSVSVAATAITVFVRKARITRVIPICVDQVHVGHGSNTSINCTSPPSHNINCTSPPSHNVNCTSPPSHNVNCTSPPSHNINCTSPPSHNVNTSINCTSPPSHNVKKKWQLTNVRMCNCVYACVCMHVCVCANACMCVRAFVHVHVWVRVFVCARASTYALVRGHGDMRFLTS